MVASVRVVILLLSTPLVWIQAVSVMILKQNACKIPKLQGIWEILREVVGKPGPLEVFRKGPESIRNRTFGTESQRLSRTEFFQEPNVNNRQFSKHNRTEKKNEPFRSVPL